MNVLLSMKIEDKRHRKFIETFRDVKKKVFIEDRGGLGRLWHSTYHGTVQMWQLLSSSSLLSSYGSSLSSL